VPTETIARHGTTLVRRRVLAPGESTPWHVDPHWRVSVVVRGEALVIEYRDGGPVERIEVRPGEAGFDEPAERVHRATNVGATDYEEVTVFLLDRPDAVAQPAGD
jgi:quercetin dioxygenase-like cupin family protein